MDPETLALFRAEADGLVESLETHLLALRDAPGDRALIDSVFRDLHTLKGTGAMFGQTAIASFLHEFESAFEAVRDGSVRVDAALISICLDARDHVADLLADGPAEPGFALLDRLRQRLAGDEAPAPAATADVAQVRFRLAAETLALGGKPQLVLDELERLGGRAFRTLDGHAPWDRDAPAQAAILGWRFEIDGSVSDDDIRGAFLFYDDGLDLEIDRGGPAAAPEASAPGLPAPQPEALSASAAPTAAPRAAEPDPVRAPAFMRVPAERLDEMMDRVGELVIAEARLNEIASRSGEPGLVQVAEDIQRLAKAMRDTAMSIRMTPIGSITGRFKRLAHDLTMATGKPVDFTLAGEETELDKTVIERLGEPLMHLMRNAVDHGLESAERRQAMGKPARGHIHLAARYSGAEVLISLSDDGRGLDREAIRRRAIDRGLMPEGSDLPDEQLHRMIFEPGFSTAASVTELSGRGVGMDVVRRTIDALRGTITLSTEPGFGTTVTLRLPLTLAIIEGMLIEVAGERFVIPMAAVEEIVELPEALAQREEGNAFLDIRERLVPFLRLRRLLGSSGVAAPYQKVIVVSAGDGRVGLVVDRIIGTNQTVIKQLSPLHAMLKTFSGATILGDGSVSLILDVAQLVAQGAQRNERDAA